MNGKFAVTLLLLIVCTSPAYAQPWAKKMFQTTEHDFGTVARGADVKFEFELQNVYQENVHIASVRSSCGCTTSSATKDTLVTWEKAAIVAQLNTRSFTGQKSATITVTFDRPYYAEVQLIVQAYIRSDVVFQPGSVDLGEVPEGETTEQVVDISYAGRSTWSIVDVRSANANFEVELNERNRSGGRVNYQMLVRLKPTAPAGYIHDQLTIVTDDQSMQTVPLPVHGRVVPALSVSPASLLIGVVAPGAKISKQLVVRGNKPFRIKSIRCSDPSFQFVRPEESKAIHLIPVTFTAGQEVGTFVQTIEIETDLGAGAKATCTATATVKSQ